MRPFIDYLRDMDDELVDISTRWEVIDHINQFSESFDSTVELHHDKTDPYMFSMSFKIRGVSYHFQGVQRNYKDSQHFYVIMFYPSLMNGDMFELQSTTSYSLDVFSGVLQSLRKMIENRQVDGFAFTADNSRLESLYSKMTPVLLKRFPEFELPRTPFRNEHGYIEYLFIRKTN